ncbi:MAG: signal recognition particle-docking protein FtsY [Phyllobacteriaceae bacterium]|nr:signal recognition particle-docking protein FtsY [Phyllobacteriaceae bacterium]
MAFGFIKKVFSFGRKPAGEHKDAPPDIAPETTQTPSAVDSGVIADSIPEIPQPDAAAPPVEGEPDNADISGAEISTVFLPGDTPGSLAPALPVKSTEENPLQESIASTKNISMPELGAAHVSAPEEAADQEPAWPRENTPAIVKESTSSTADISIVEIAPAAAPPVAAAVSPAPRAGKIAVGKAVEAVVERAPEPIPQPKRRWFQRLRDGLSRSSKELTSSVAGVFTKRKLDEETLEELEEVLIRADLGAETAIRISGALAEGRFGRDISDADIRTVMAREIEKTLAPVAKPLELDLGHKPHVILVVGVNGTGKTTTIGKLAAKLRAGGLDVMLAAGDTFRAAAIEQLHIWGERTGSTVVSNRIGADAAGLAYEAYEKAKEAKADVLIVDTAGRLQNRAELMAELEKIVRVLGKLDADAPHTVLQTLDATTGQNALSQVEIFRNVAGVNGLVMTKLDGTARGGILVAIAAKHKLPVYFIGVGEGVDDLEPFAAKDFAEAIAGVNP